jgi:hypothetical protein
MASEFLTKIISYGFGIFAFFIFLYSFFYTSEEAYKKQAIYWFYGSLISTLIPQIKQFKYKDLEVVFREELQKVEKNINQKVTKLESDFLGAVEQVRSQEASLSPEYRQWRGEVFNDFAKHLEALSPEEQLSNQENFSRSYLQNLTITLPELKVMFKKLDYYDGAIDDLFTSELVECIKTFQQTNGIEPIDGIFGNLTYTKLAALLSEH